MAASLASADGSAPAAPFDREVARMVPFVRLVAERQDIAARYRAASPYPHVVLDGIFDPQVLDRVASGGGPDVPWRRAA